MVVTLRTNQTYSSVMRAQGETTSVISCRLRNPPSHNLLRRNVTVGTDLFSYSGSSSKKTHRKSMYTENRTVTMYIQVLLLSLLAVGSVVAFKGFDDNFIGYVLQANACVSKSGNLDLYKKYVGCADDLPKPIKDVYDSCKNSVYPDGFGSCDDGTLLKSEDDKTKFEECFIMKLPQFKSLDSSEDKAQEKFMKCIYKNGNKCLMS
ncbi:uncharacterized protein TNCT_362501 [Trichonephila clavata]|uniref:Uncharacterized protein n=1 Tax=Trichonephila clavata TaxID=2740835 RepID=A0A8X6GE27_TRICU|nr:uncharacterized protein TNCT_362501 [Trichonephila clavata]